MRCLLALLLMSGCRFDPSGVPPLAHGDRSPGENALDLAAPDGPRDVSTERPSDVGADSPDLAQPDLRPPDIWPAGDLFPVCTPPCGGGAPICCDKGKGLECTSSYASVAGRCRCDTVTAVPCGGSYPVCCDKGAGGECYAQNDTDDCVCDIASGAPCVGTSYDICCDKGSGPVCTNSYSSVLKRCRCDLTTGKPCGGTHPVCCDKGSGGECYQTNDTDGCACDLVSGAPCTGTSYSACCDKGSGPRCYNSC